MGSRIKSLVAFGALSLFGVALAQPARAGIVNGGFESATDFQGWSVIGNASVQTTDFHPSEGSQLAVLSNSNNPAPDSNPAETNQANLASFFNVSTATLAANNVFSASGAKQTFFSTLGDSVTFDANFATNQGGYVPDISFVTLTDPNGNTTFVSLNSLFSSTPLVATTPSVSDYFSQETGWVTFVFAPTQTGNWTLAFGISNDFPDGVTSSGLMLDNFAGATGTDTSVPLPSTAWAGIALLGGFGTMQLGRRRRAALA